MESKSRTQVSSTGYLCFSDFSSTTTAIPQQLDQELFNLQSGMELLDFPSSKNLQQTVYNSDSVTLPKPHHGPYQHEFYQNPRIHVFTGGYSDLATHSIFPSSSSFQTQQLKNSKFLEPAKELLNEFCNIGTIQTSNTSTKHMIPKISKWEGSSSSEGTNQSLYSIDLQKRKAKLVSMLEEVDRRYKHYCEQTRLVVSSFESVAGNGTTNVYLGLASKAMSKHFRCLRDGIVGQIQALREKESVAPGMTRGETPRLKVLDQALRKQIAFQQMGAIETHPWRPQRGLPERSVSVLRAWLFEHFLHPYPSDVDKHILARQTGLSRSQVSNWFINARVRLWKPMVEEMYMQETKAHDKDLENPNPNSQTVTAERPSPDYYYKKPTSQDLSESLASIINSETGSARNGKNQQEEQLDFSSYNHAASTVTYSNDDSCNHHLNMGNSGRGGVSLTLGLQHSGGGVSHSFSPVAHHSMFLSREQHMEELGFLDAEETQGSSGFGSQGLPYRNMAGGQLLHHFVG